MSGDVRVDEIVGTTTIHSNEEVTITVNGVEYYFENISKLIYVLEVNCDDATVVKEPPSK